MHRFVSTTRTRQFKNNKEDDEKVVSDYETDNDNEQKSDD